MRTRRSILWFLAGTALAPFAAQSQTKGSLPLVAVLWHGTEERELANIFFGWLRDEFDAAGLKADVNVRIKHFFADESDARYAVLAPEMVALRPDVLVSIAGPPTYVLKKFHGSIPLTFVTVEDPIAGGIVREFGRRSENISGSSRVGNEILSKRIALLKEALPSSEKFALIVNSKSKYQTDLDMIEGREAARRLSLIVEPFDIVEPDQIRAVFASIKEWGSDGAVLSTSPMFALFRKEIAQAAMDAHVPLMSRSYLTVEDGALMGYSDEPRQAWVTAASYVKRVLGGEFAGDLPVTQPTKFELMLNNRTTQVLGLTFPPRFLAQVDRFID